MGVFHGGGATGETTSTHNPKNERDGTEGPKSLQPFATVLGRDAPDAIRNVTEGSTPRDPCTTCTSASFSHIAQEMARN